MSLATLLKIALALLGFGKQLLGYFQTKQVRKDAVAADRYQNLNKEVSDVARAQEAGDDPAVLAPRGDGVPVDPFDRAGRE